MRWRRMGSEAAGCAVAARFALALVLAAAAQIGWAAETAAEESGEAVKQAETAPAEDAKASPAKAKERADSAEGTDLDVETILNNPLDDEAYRDRRSCLRTRAIDRVEVLDETMVLFHVRRNKAWLNQLSSRCLGLDRDMIINLRIFGGSLCRLDTFRGLTRMGGHMPTAHCRLGDFEAIEGPQIEALRTALEERRNAAKLERKNRRAERRERRKAERRKSRGE